MLVTLDIVTTIYKPGQEPTIQPKKGLVVTPPYALHGCSIYTREIIKPDQILHTKSKPNCPNLYIRRHHGKKFENVCITLNNIAMLETDDGLCLSPNDVIEIKFGASTGQNFSETVTIRSITN